ncbi:MAG: transporter [Herminiimonas sp.]|nr:transporter [Herminiimonas sp.]
MNILSKSSFSAAIIFSSASLAFAQEAHNAQAGHDEHKASASAHSAGGTEASTVDGEVKKVDKEAGKITIRHGELKNLGMPAMTMVFRAKDPAMLDRVKAGDKVKFIAEKVGGAFTLVQLENVR